jgi:hypothetical protein
VGALCYVDLIVLDGGRPYGHPATWLDVDWPILSVLFAPTAAAALLAAWWSKQSSRDALALLARFLALIIVVVEATAIWRLYLGRYIFLALIGAQILLIGAFFFVGLLIRIANNRLTQWRERHSDLQRSATMEIMAAGLTEVSAYQVLVAKGYEVANRGSDWLAQKDTDVFRAESPLMLLGLVAMAESRGTN